MLFALEILVPIYLVSLHVSMAGMEIFGWITVIVGAIARRRMGHSFQAYGLLPALIAYVFTGLISLLVNPEWKPFGPQAGFLRFAVLLLGLSSALDLVWSDAFSKKLLRVWWCALIVTGAYAFMQMLTGIDLMPHRMPVVEPVGALWKATGFFSISLTFAYSIGISIWAGAGAGLTERKTRNFALLAFVFGCMGLFASTARGAWLAFFVCAALYVLAERRRWAFAFGAITVLGLGLLYAFADLLGGKISKLAHFEFDHSSTMRFDLWRGYWAMFQDHPWFGVGLFNGDKLLPEYYGKLGIIQPFVSHAHNNYLQSLVGTGLFGFLAYCWLIAVPLVMAYRMRHSSAWGWPLFLGQIFLHLGGLTECCFIDGEVNHMLMFVWALTAVLHARENSTPANALRY